MSASSNAALVAFASLLLSGCASSSFVPSQQELRVRSKTIAALKSAGDADSLAAAATLSRIGKNGATALELINRAVELAPNRPDLVWWQIRLCQAVAGCDAERFEQRLRSLDPSNGAGWLDALARADRSQDKTAAEAALTAIAATERVDLYWTDMAAHLSRAVINTHRTSTQDAPVEIIGVMAAFAIPALKSVVSSCRDRALQQSGRVELCQGIARSLRNGDTIIMNSVGATIAQWVWPEKSPEWNAAVEWRLTNSYRTQFFAADTGPGLKNTDHFLDLNSRYHREEDVWRQALIEAGHDPEPPHS